MLREVKIKNQKKQFVESSELKYKGGVMKTFIRTLILQLLCICICFAGNKKQDVFHGARIIYDEHSGVPTSLEFKGDNKPKAESFFQIFKSAYNFSEENKFAEFRLNKDKLGQTHHRYKQYYKGIELAEVQYLLHEKDGFVEYAHGRFIQGLNLNETPTLTESAALQFALKYINAKQYMWENPAYIFLLKGSSSNGKTFYPKGKLMISSGSKEQRRENFRLIYRFDINTAVPFGGYSVDVDANTGEIIGQLPLVYNEDVQGYGQSNFNGKVPIIVNNEFSPQSPYVHLDDWNAFGGNGKSWWFADSTLGSEGGYGNYWYQVLDVDPVTLTRDSLKLSFYHRYSMEVISDFESPPEGFDDWDGMNVRISVDSGTTWQVLANPTPSYTSNSLYSFGTVYAEGKGIPGWSGLKKEWCEVTFDLSSFANKTIQIRFALASDQGGSTADILPWCFGWQIDDISISNSTGVIYANNGSTVGVKPKNNLVEPVHAKYYLRDGNKDIRTLNAKFDNEGRLIKIFEFTDDDSLFIDDDDKPGVSIQWATESTLEFYLQKFGRISYDDNGSSITSYANWVFFSYDGTVYPNNAAWMGNGAVFGKGDGTWTNPWVSLDIIGHETTHGVTQYSAGLDYINESGALNESFSDIFGTCVEFFKEGTNGNWLCGEDVIINGYERSMQLPKLKNQPDCYNGLYWIDEIPTPENDMGGVHINSGVQNYWFYLLCEGGSGTNDNGDVYSVDGIGIEDAEQIVYRNLTTYLMPTSQFKDARLGSIHAAIDLFGINSPQHKAVIDAWDAVGVYYPFVGPYAEECQVDNSYKNPGLDTLYITTKISNPDNQYLIVNALIENLDQNKTDTVALYDDGLHQDSIEADNFYCGFYSVPIGESMYDINISTYSADSGYNNISRNVARFTSAGPVKIDSIAYINYKLNLCYLKPFARNQGNISTIRNVKVNILCDDSWALPTLRTVNLPDIPPDTVVGGTSWAIIRYDSLFPGNFNLKFEILSDGWIYWIDSTKVIVTGVEEATEQPLAFRLEQNFPNPFNPTTTIKYSIPDVETRHASSLQSVTLKVYDILGREIALLVNEKQKPGYYEVKWDAGNQPSGVYFYRLRAGSFNQVKKMLLIK